ncbi:plasmid recombination enzyme family protein (plasmid) [Bacillus pseudomycoides]|nr:plasmid recombination protein [Bacillus pseudomycoides]AIK35220.1 plasmid recombination enzyme family protein [Bacillus pseudomycoides]AJI14436.1 plasmid recombination enzyme family protein [Bacillus pseudomycoides]MED4714657.1 plasmid recombination protein [Bacillus pseudomycoides]OOR47726.1 plasmid recombination enzyme [Bacillus pseudomycoides]PDY09990.1 plasmid recombination enzyme [Bacillus pseudomycoides]
MSMSVSLKKATNKTNIKHNNRTMSEKEKERNSHIDYSRSDENKYLVQKDLKELYQEEFGEALEKYNAKQKRSDRKIDDYYKHIQSSKKTSLQQEMIIQVGDLNDFIRNADYKRANEILLEWFKDFEKRNPNLKVYNAVIHNDETSPHMHLNFVPVASGYKRGLEKQVSFDRAIMQQDSALDKTRPFDDWREKEVKLLEKILKERGIERKLVGSNEYKDVNEYKEKKDLEREIQWLEEKIAKKKDELVKVSEQVPEKKMNLKSKKKEIKTEVKPKFIGKPDIIEKETGNYVYTPKQVKYLEDLVSAAVTVKKDYERLQTTDLVQENKNLREEVYQKTKENEQLKKELASATLEIGSLKGDIHYLKAHIRDLKANIKVLYEQTKKVFKEQFEAFRGLIKNELDIKGIDNQFEREHNREMKSKSKQKEHDMDRGR